MPYQNWTYILSPTDVQESLRADVYNLCLGYLVPGQPNPITDALNRATMEVRSRVAANRANMLGPDGTVPDECQASGGALAAWYFLKRLQINDEAIIKSPREAHDDAQRDLSRVARGEKLIVGPPEPSISQGAQEMIVQVRPGNQQMTREALEGL